MKKISFIILTVCTLVLCSIPASALMLLNEDFSSASIVAGGIDDLSDIVLHTWYDNPATASSPVDRWKIVDDSGDYIAQHLPTATDNRNILFTGVDATGLGIGTNLTLGFAYTFGEPTTPAQATVYLAGLNFPGDSLDRFAPWFEGEGASSNDGTVLLRQDLTIPSGGWVSPTIPLVQLTEEFDALAVAFIFGDGESFMAIDDVTLQSSAPVPEPATMLLLGFGLVGFAGFGRKKFIRKQG